ncbi:MAG: hypothetical protein HYW38_02500 [Candidatus Colwellbacteria bacterium]|nr:hypothetical protein [Candidatus Colwellbacteria bacterium]
MALGASDLKKGSAIVVDGTPYVVLTVSHSHVGRGGAVFQSKIKNLKTGNILERNFKPGDSVETAEISKMQAVFIYERRPASAKAAAGKGEYWFHQLGKPDQQTDFPLELMLWKIKRLF